MVRRHSAATGSADDFSNVHEVSVTIIEQYEARGAHALDVTRTWLRTRYDAGLAVQSPAVPIDSGWSVSGQTVWTSGAAARRRRRHAVRQDVVAAIAGRLDLTQARMTATGAVPAAGSVAELLYTEHGRITSNSALRLVGAGGMVADDPVSAPWVDRFLYRAGLRLGGGTDEIQRNTIAERGLGLPRAWPMRRRSVHSIGVRRVLRRAIERLLNEPWRGT